MTRTGVNVCLTLFVKWIWVRESYAFLLTTLCRKVSKACILTDIARPILDSWVIESGIDGGCK